MRFFYCNVCQHYHVDDDRLPCNELGRHGSRAVFLADPRMVATMRKQSQGMLNSPDVFFQTLKEVE